MLVSLFKLNYLLLNLIGRTNDLISLLFNSPFVYLTLLIPSARTLSMSSQTPNLLPTKFHYQSWIFNDVHAGPSQDLPNRVLSETKDFSFSLYS
jgi:hypothetical protein